MYFVTVVYFHINSSDKLLWFCIYCESALKPDLTGLIILVHFKEYWNKDTFHNFGLFAVADYKVNTFSLLFFLILKHQAI